MADLNTIHEAIEDMNSATEAWKTAHDAQLKSVVDDVKVTLDRVEELEARFTDPKRQSPKSTGEGSDYRAFETKHGTGYLVSAKAKLAEAMRNSEQAPVSLERWLGSHIAGETSSDQEAKEFAREHERKQLTTGTSGLVIPAAYQSQWWDLIRAQMPLNAAGMQTMVMTAKSHTGAAVATDPAATFRSEGGAISADNPTFAERVLTAKTIAVRCQASVEVAQDSPNFGAQLLQVMTAAIAQEISRVGLHGSGVAPEPQGIYGASGVSTVAGIGTPTDYSDLVEGVRTLLDANIPLEIASANAILSPRTWETYENLPTGITNDITPLPRPKSLENMQFQVTTAVSDALGASPAVDSAIFMGDFRDLILGVRRDASVEVLKAQTYATNLLLEFIGYARVDYLIARPASFVVLQGVTSA